MVPLKAGFPSFHMLREYQKKDYGGNGRSSKIRNGLGIEDRSGFVSEKGQDKNQHYIESFPEKGKRQGCFGPLHSCEAVYQYILKTQRYDGKGEHTDGPYGKAGNLLIGGKQADKMHRKKTGHEKHKSCKAKTQKQAVFLGIPYPPRIGCSVVKTDESLGTAADSQHGRGDEQHVALDNGGSGDEKISLAAAVLLQHRIGGDEKHII